MSPTVIVFKIPCSTMSVILLINSIPVDEGTISLVRTVPSAFRIRAKVSSGVLIARRTCVWVHQDVFGMRWSSGCRREPHARQSFFPTIVLLLPDAIFRQPCLEVRRSIVGKLSLWHVARQRGVTRHLSIFYCFSGHFYTGVKAERGTQLSYFWGQPNHRTFTACPRHCKIFSTRNKASSGTVTFWTSFS